ncbi:MAG: universal stress protein [Chloroflexi bacterium]|nr:universal stress protein [Chloroflexota bacterium]
MFERLLVALDGSEQSETTLPYVEEMAGRLGSEVVLLRVCESERRCPADEARTYLEQQAKIVRRLSVERGAPVSRREVSVRTEVRMGKPADNIIDFAAQTGIGLIVMAAHGRSGVTRWAVGSVADKVLRATNLPMALISGPAPAGRELFSRALLPLDGSHVGEAALPYAEELAAKMGTELVLLQVLEFKYVAYGAEVGGYVPYPQEWLNAAEQSARTYLAGIDARLRARGLKVSWRVESGSAPDTIVQVAEKAKADFIAMSTHGRSGMGRWVMGSVADHVVHNGKMPVILVRARPEERK